MAKIRVDQPALPREENAQGGCYAHQRGEIKDNHLHALLCDPPVSQPGRAQQEGQGELPAQGQIWQAVGARPTADDPRLLLSGFLPTINNQGANGALIVLTEEAIWQRQLTASKACLNRTLTHP